MKPLAQVFAVPIVLGVISLIGLLSALLADGLWDGVSWLTLGVVIGVATWYGFPRVARRTRADQGAAPAP